MNDGVSALFDMTHSYKITWILAFPKQVDHIEMSKQISWLLEYGKYHKYCSTAVVKTTFGICYKETRQRK